jgi:hypothetical protein
MLIISAVVSYTNLDCQRSNLLKSITYYLDMTSGRLVSSRGPRGSVSFTGNHCNILLLSPNVITSGRLSQLNGGGSDPFPP